MEQFSRFSMIIGENNIKLLLSKKIAVFGLGGVGGHACEALARSGVGSFDLFDFDTISVSNINRQLIATHDSVGRKKTEVMKQRILSINPNAIVETHDVFYLNDENNTFDLSKYDYIIDAIDTVSAKLELIEKANRLNIPIISSMGTGNKLNPLQLEVTDIYKTINCPLAKVIRYELRKRGIKKLKVVYSKEIGVKSTIINEETNKAIPGSSPFVPSVAGIVIASEVVKDLIKE